MFLDQDNVRIYKENYNANKWREGSIDTLKYC